MTTNSTQELKPCPFCGGEAVAHNIPWGNRFQTNWQVQCSLCKLWQPTGHGDSKADAITAWNTRATSAPAGDVVELLGTWKTEIKARMEFKEMQRSFHKGIYTEGAARADESDRALIERIEAAIVAIPAPSVVGEDKLVRMIEGAALELANSGASPKELPRAIAKRLLAAGVINGGGK